MRAAFVIFVIAVLGLSYDVFAQSPPKQVIVENGSTNPVPIVDISPAQGELIWESQSFSYPFTIPAAHHNHPIWYDIPTGKLFKLKGVSGWMLGDADASQTMEIYEIVDGSFRRPMWLLFDKGVHYDSGSQGILYREFHDDLPPFRDKIYFNGMSDKSIDTPHIKPTVFYLTWWGYLVDDPTQ